MNHQTDAELGAALKRAYPLPEGYARRVERSLAALTAKEEIPVMKKTATFALALAALLALLTGAAALSHWGVLDFLFYQGPRDDLQHLTQPVGLDSTQDGVQLKIDSAFYDGETFAMDWTIRNTTPQAPAYVQVDEFTVGGQRVHTDGNDGFDGQWLPGVFAQEGGMQDGERVELPLTRLQGDAQPVRMTVGIYRPVQPLYRLPVDQADLTKAQQDAQRKELAQLASAKMAEGYLVLWDDLFAMADPEAEHGVIFVLGDIASILPPEAYTRTTLTAAFDLDTRPARAALTPLNPQDSYRFDHMTTEYIKAHRTPAGVYLELLARPLPGQEEAFEALLRAGDWKATDQQGKPIDKWPSGFEVLRKRFPDGAEGYHVRLALALTTEELPDTISLSFLPADGGPALISPVSTNTK